jgi:hypothetical protein
MTLPAKPNVAAAIAAAVTLAGLLAPAAAAMPGDPLQGCTTYGLGGTVCDGPIRPDGTWKRCTYSPAWYGPTAGGGPQTNCAIVTTGQLPPLMGLTPPTHIDD